MKEFTVLFRQTFETKLEVTVEASSEKAAINKARKLSKRFSSPDDADTCVESYCPDTYGGDDFQVVEP